MNEHEHCAVFDVAEVVWKTLIGGAVLVCSSLAVFEVASQDQFHGACGKAYKRLGQPQSGAGVYA
jgi:hypothetical protein